MHQRMLRCRMSWFTSCAMWYHGSLWFYHGFHIDHTSFESALPRTKMVQGKWWCGVDGREWRDSAKGMRISDSIFTLPAPRDAMLAKSPRVTLPSCVSIFVQSYADYTLWANYHKKGAKTHPKKMQNTNNKGVFTDVFTCCTPAFLLATLV